MAVTSPERPAPRPTMRGFEFASGQAGLRVAIVAAASPVDYAAIEACWDLAETLRQRPPIGGTVRVVPIADEPSFLARSIVPYGPAPDRDPGEDGRYAGVRDGLRELVASSDVVIDVRGGGLHALEAHWVAGGVPATARAGAVDVGAVLAHVPADLCLELDPVASPVPLGVSTTAAAMATPWIIVASGGIARGVAAGSARLLSSLLATLGRLGAIADGVAAARPGHPVGPAWWRHEVQDPGLWTPVVEAGERVETGDILGSVSDLLGESRTSVVSPLDGWVLRVTTSLGVGGGRAGSGTGAFADTITIVGDRAP